METAATTPRSLIRENRPLSDGQILLRNFARRVAFLTTGGAVFEAALEWRAEDIAPTCISGTVELVDFGPVMIIFLLLAAGFVFSLGLATSVFKRDTSNATVGLCVLALFVGLTALGIFSAMPSYWSAANYSGPAEVSCWSF
jgi:hypothetical protein